MSDSPKVTEQISLTTSSGRSWLVIGGIIAALCVGLLIPMTWLTPPGVAAVGILIEVALYVAMIAVRFAVRRLRVRLAMLAVLTALIALAFLICGGIVATSEWNLA